MDMKTKTYRELLNIIEEKAKRYDEAIKKSRSLYDNYDTVSTLIDVKEELENIFPELAESKDERVKKAIFGMVYDSDNELWSSYDVSKSDVLAWLEKQGEHQEYPKDVIDNAISFLANRNDGMPEEEAKDIVNAIITVLNPSYWPKQGEQKSIVPKFKIGDKVRRKSDGLEAKVINVVDGNTEVECEDWTKFILDNEWELIEWSEEDESMFNRCVKTMKSAYYMDREALCWLENRFKCLRPQSSWKPSEEQLQHLKTAAEITEDKGYITSGHEVRKLIEQLKAL